MTGSLGRGWRVLGASVMGSAHLRAGLPCQDAHAYRALPGGAVLVAADGAGSAERAEEGAGLAANAACGALVRALAGGWPSSEAGWQALMLEAYGQARQAVLIGAQAAGSSARAYATTLLCAAVWAEGFAVAQLGDGVAVAALSGGGWFLAAAPQKGEYANETHFLTQPGALDRLEVAAFAELPQGLAVMTDGLLRLVLDLERKAPHVPFFRPLLAFAHGAPDEDQGCADLAAFLASDRVTARTDDDKTLVLAVRWPPAEPGGGA
ncbi:MAG: protein phosphatase 2C domain-containing protein [Anaerolineales bacterium]|nr:protein phosphatase 2C domain-containing protein [Anaerolineales bacterium]